MPLRSRGKTVVGISLPHPAPRGSVGGSPGVAGGCIVGLGGTWAGGGWPGRASGGGGPPGGAWSSTWTRAGSSPGAQITKQSGENRGGQMYIHQPQLGGLVPAGVPGPHKVPLIIYNQLGCTCSTHSHPLVVAGNLIQMGAGPHIGQGPQGCKQLSPDSPVGADQKQP